MTETAATAGTGGDAGSDAVSEQLWEVFVRSARGLSHVHVGSLRAADARLAMLSARDLYTRRQEGVSLWVVRSSDLHCSDPADKEAYFEPAAGKPYRHPGYYTIPEGVTQI
ncbi:1,2-phenylacetyl-CoA epoxidase subunit PaaB [Streptomyces sp. NPDC051677]|uniref:1,2-phenylacetyl-CoA epoxidase subunit PaaB n=1 Tax=Streptomyces sp. NPDC051677 TaxID=3365669 RepID=UPI0037D2A81F